MFDTVRGSYAEDDLGSFGREESPVPTDDDCFALGSTGHGGEDRLDKVLGVVRLLEDFHLFAKPRCARLLARIRLGGDGGDFVIGPGAISAASRRDKGEV